ncbi:hypothetical protein [Streptomyces sp. NPDC059761]|uniref:hypothetical protein n=1 Tax=Streptomyces sp. NPDC059761 TaxID=3346937 RepID=UPI00364FCB58
MSAGPVPLTEVHTAVDEWISCPNIVFLETGVKTVGGHETGERAIVVGVVQKKSPASLTALDFPVPPMVEADVIQPDGSIRRMSVPTDVIETGWIRPLAALSQHQRPCPGGFQIASPRPTSWFQPWGWDYVATGTLGVTVEYRGRRCLLTNCHVIGDRSHGPGLVVYQPTPAILEFLWSNAIGVCDGTFDVRTHASDREQNPRRNVYDFAWCEVPSDLELTSHAIPGIHDGTDPLKIKYDPAVEDQVMWLGASTGEVQRGIISSLRATWVCREDDGRYSYWVGMSLKGGVGQEGDSGAALIREDSDGGPVPSQYVIGLLSSGSESGKAAKMMATYMPPQNDSGTLQEMRPRIQSV